MTTTTKLPLNQNIAPANQSRFEAGNYSEPLTSFTVGWKDPENIQAILDAIAPKILVNKRFEFKKANNSEAFLSELNDIRAVGSSFKYIEYSGETVQSKTLNKGLTIRVDHDEVSGSDWQERMVQLLMQRLYRNELRRAIALVDEAAQPVEVKWNKNANPDADIRIALMAAANQSGIRPNRILFGESAWDLRTSTYESKETSSAYRAADFAPKDLAQKLLVDDIQIMRARYHGQPNQKTQMLGNVIYAYYASDNISKDEPSNFKRFVTPTESGSDFRVYLEESAKYTDLTVEHYSNIVVTSPVGIQKIILKQS